jgi:methyltransferase-like protein 6
LKGATLYPLLPSHPKTFFYVCDFAENAISLVKVSILNYLHLTLPKSNELYDETRCKAFVCDIVKDSFPDYIQENSVDLILLIFVMSAIKPEDMEAVLRKLHRLLKPGGAIMFRGSFWMSA